MKQSAIAAVAVLMLLFVANGTATAGLTGGARLRPGTQNKSATSTGATYRANTTTTRRSFSFEPGSASTASTGTQYTRRAPSRTRWIFGRRCR